MEAFKLQEYNIYITEKFREQHFFTDFLAATKYSSVYILVDENTESYCLPAIRDLLPNTSYTLLKVEAGEKNKDIATCLLLWQQLAKNNADRKSLLINLGGGVIGDMGGFVASTFKRGFEFINIPTTLLAQVDASVGGKLGIDYNGVKNMIGLFNNPQEIFMATEFFATLPERELRSGFAEVLKHGLIRSRKYWDDVKNTDLMQSSEWMKIVTGSVEIKKNVVQEDQYENGVRKILNFGHTIGHAVETVSMQYETDHLLHGEAIAVGMICEAWLSSRINRLPEEECSEIINVIGSYFPFVPVHKYRFDEIMENIRQDKKNTGGHLFFSLLSEIGTCEFDCDVPEKTIKEAVEFYAGLA